MCVFQNNADIQHNVIVHEAFGKGFIKQMKVSFLVFPLEIWVGCTILKF